MRAVRFFPRTLKGGKTSSEGSSKQRGDSNRAEFRREHRDNASCYAGTAKRNWRLLSKSLVRTGGVIVVILFFEHTSKMALVQDKHFAASSC